MKSLKLYSYVGWLSWTHTLYTIKLYTYTLNECVDSIRIKPKENNENRSSSNKTLMKHSELVWINTKSLFQIAIIYTQCLQSQTLEYLALFIQIQWCDSQNSYNL